MRYPSAPLWRLFRRSVLPVRNVLSSVDIFGFRYTSKLGRPSSLMCAIQPYWQCFIRKFANLNRLLPSRDNVIFTDSTSGSVSLLNFTTVGAAVVLVVGVGVVVVVVTTPLAAGLDSAPGCTRVDPQ